MLYTEALERLKTAPLDPAWVVAALSRAAKVSRRTKPHQRLYAMTILEAVMVALENRTVKNRATLMQYVRPLHLQIRSGYGFQSVPSAKARRRRLKAMCLVVRAAKRL